MDKGYVYVLTNPSFKEDWVKIGKSSRLPNVRSKELFNTATPLPYEIYATLCTEKYNEAEKMIHHTIDILTHSRIHVHREFFNIAPEKAYEILREISTLLGDEAEAKLYGDNVETKPGDGTKIKGERFNFYKKGLKDGDSVSFISDPNIKAIVASSRQVLYEGTLWYLSPLTKTIFDKKGLASPSGSYQGPAFFSFQGKKLTEL
jgi:hypothetical protein